MLEILIRPQAKNDIKKIWSYTNKIWGEIQADSYINALGQAIEGLISNPKIGNSINEVQKDCRLYHFKHHLLVYRLSTSSIEIIRVLGENMEIHRNL